jgi:hypothetical protein
VRPRCEPGILRRLEHSGERLLGGEPGRSLAQPRSHSFELRIRLAALSVVDTSVRRTGADNHHRREVGDVVHAFGKRVRFSQQNTVRTVVREQLSESSVRRFIRIDALRVVGDRRRELTLGNAMRAGLDKGKRDFYSSSGAGVAAAEGLSATSKDRTNSVR